jgi:CheY-like chemotaxis protein
VSRIITGKMRIDVQPIDLGAVVNAAVEVVRPAADAKDIHLVATVDPRAVRVAGDADRLQQVVWNLVSNAIKFTPREGRVTVRVHDEGARVCIVVEDTGQGFRREFQPHLFDRFQQQDSSITRQHGGLGLGLAIVRHIVELHGGTVRGESAGEGQGATFTVVLPRRAAMSSVPDGGDLDVPSAATTADKSRLAGSRVLIVDDEPDSNDVVSTILSVHGADVRVASSVAQALEVLKSWRPHVVISDIGMPDHDGMSLLASMRRDPTLARIPAIALTAYATREDRVRILGAGFLMHLAKPIAGDELVASIVSVMTTLGKR